MSERWRLILQGKSHGATNMAVDQAIFRSVESGRSPATLRFYGWSPPTISLGYAQSIEVLDIERCRESGIGIVKRPTGGKAVFHDAEVTYSLCSPIPSRVFPNTLKGSCMTINSCIARGLAGLATAAGTPAGETVAIAMSPESGGRKSRTVCFEEPSVYEIVANGKKLAGSAQRRTDRGFLHHGAIPLDIRWRTLVRLFRDSSLPSVPNAVGLGECLGRSVEDHEVIEALLRSFSDVLGIVFEPGALMDEELAMVDTLSGFGRIH